MKKVSFKIDYNVDFECVGAPIPKIIRFVTCEDIDDLFIPLQHLHFDELLKFSI